MDIIFKEKYNTYVEFYEIKVGECFENRNCVYIKVSQSQDKKSNNSFNVTKNYMCSFSERAICSLLDVDFVVNGYKKSEV